MVFIYTPCSRILISSGGEGNKFTGSLEYLNVVTASILPKQVKCSWCREWLHLASGLKKLNSVVRSSKIFWNTNFHFSRNFVFFFLIISRFPSCLTPPCQLVLIISRFPTFLTPPCKLVLIISRFPTCLTPPCQLLHKISRFPTCLTPPCQLVLIISRFPTCLTPSL